MPSTGLVMVVSDCLFVTADILNFCRTCTLSNETHSKNVDEYDDMLIFHMYQYSSLCFNVNRVSTRMLKKEMQYCYRVLVGAKT